MEAWHSMSTFSSYLPSLLRSERAPDPVARDMFTPKLGRKVSAYDTATQAKPIATGDCLAIYATGCDQNGNPSSRDTHEHSTAAHRIGRLARSLGVEVVITEEAKHEDIVSGLASPELSDILFIGHSDRSNLVFPETVSWKTVADATNYLKASFGVIGCAEVYRGVNAPRAGHYAVEPDGLLYGKSDEQTLPQEMCDLANFQILEI